MSISRKEIKHIAQLARLSFSDKQIRIFQEELSAILRYIDKLKKVKVEINNGNLSKREQLNVFRRDERGDKKGYSYDKGKLLKVAPEKKDNFFKVPPVFNKK